MDNVVKPMAVSYWLSHFQGYQVRHHIYQVKTLKNKIIPSYQADTKYKHTGIKDTYTKEPFDSWITTLLNSCIKSYFCIQRWREEKSFLGIPASTSFPVRTFCGASFRRGALFSLSTIRPP